MIGKIFPKSAGSFKSRIRYIYGGTKHDHEVTGIRTIDSNCTSSDPLPGILAGDETGVQEMIQEFDSVEAMRRMSIDSDKQIKPVFHAMLSLRPGESLTSSQWRSAVQKYLADLGFDETNQDVAVMHRDKDHEHVHIVANRIRLNEEFSMVKDSNERSMSLTSVSEIEDRFGLQKAPKPKDTLGVALSHAEVKASIRDGELPHKHRMIAKIAGAIEATNTQRGDMFTFVRALRKQRVYIHLTLNEDVQPKSISYEFDGKHIFGRQLKRLRLTWRKLTTLRGISYDPESIHELQREIERRNSEEHERIRFYFYEFSSKRQRIYIKFTAKQIELFKMIEEVLEILRVLFGGIFTATERNTKKKYIDISPPPCTKFIATWIRS